MTTRATHDLAVIGAGPGGYVAAICAAQKGKNVALIDAHLIGGCCLNVGCIPTKTLISCAKELYHIRRAEQFGIKTGPITIDYSVMVQKKDQIVAKIRASLEMLIRSNKITIYRGQAQFVSPRELKVIGTDSLYIEAEKIIIATGSSPQELRHSPCDHQRILNSTSLLNLTTLPQSLAIIGGGYIGSEFASLFRDLGVTVTMIEALPTILHAQGPEIAKFMTKSFQTRGIQIRSQVRVQEIKNHGSHVTITLDDGTYVNADIVLVAVGRKIETESLALHKAGLSVDEKGAILTDHHMETVVKGIYAIGDVTGKGMLAHSASHQGMVAASHAVGQEMHNEDLVVPSVIFTHPEVASVGLTVAQALQAGNSADIANFPMQALGKAQGSQEVEGFFSIVFEKTTHQILGAQVIGQDASNLISSMTLAIQHELTLEAVFETIIAHPTLAEGWHEAAAIALNSPIHMPPRMR